jgi:hypothetical protein
MAEEEGTSYGKCQVILVEDVRKKRISAKFVP